MRGHIFYYSLTVYIFIICLLTNYRRVYALTVSATIPVTLVTKLFQLKFLLHDPA